MARLVPVKCPNCGANVRVDPERELATCDYCHTSSFVQTGQRRVTEEMRQQHPVIDLTAATNKTLVVFLLASAAMTLVSVLGGAVFIFARASGGSVPAVPEPGLAESELDRSRSYSLKQAAVSGAITGPLAPPAPEATAVTDTERKNPSDVPRPKTGATPAEVSRVAAGATTVSGRLAPKVIDETVRKNFGRFRLCHEQALGRTPHLSGTVKVRFVIGRDGSVSNVSNGGSDVADSALTSCLLSAFYGLKFPPPEGGIVTVVYPLVLRAEPKTR